MNISVIKDEEVKFIEGKHKYDELIIEPLNNLGDGECLKIDFKTKEEAHKVFSALNTTAYVHNIGKKIRRDKTIIIYKP